MVLDATHTHKATVLPWRSESSNKVRLNVELRKTRSPSHQFGCTLPQQAFPAFCTAFEGGGKTRGSVHVPHWNLPSIHLVQAHAENGECSLNETRRAPASWRHHYTHAKRKHRICARAQMGAHKPMKHAHTENAADGLATKRYKNQRKYTVVNKTKKKGIRNLRSAKVLVTFGALDHPGVWNNACSARASEASSRNQSCGSWKRLEYWKLFAAPSRCRRAFRKAGCREGSFRVIGRALRISARTPTVAARASPARPGARRSGLRDPSRRSRPSG